jgi:hypothetical protein
MLFAAVTHLLEGQSLKALLEKSVICLVGTRRPAISVTVGQSILFLKTLIRDKASIFVA